MAQPCTNFAHYLKEYKAMNGIYTNQITIDIQTINWTMGYYYSCDVLALKGCSFAIEWGDGKNDQCKSNGDWISLIHEYPKSDYRNELPYRIRVYTRDPNGFIGFREGGSEVATQKLDPSQCPSLQYLTYHDLTSLDVSHNSALRELDCSRSQIKSLELDTPLLETLNCCFSRELTRLNLSRCPLLHELDCRLCVKLTRLGLNNRSFLLWVNYAYTAHADKVEEHMLSIVQQNGGKAVKDDEEELWDCLY